MSTYGSACNIGREHGGPPDPPEEMGPAEATSRLRVLIDGWFPANSPIWREAHTLLNVVGEGTFNTERKPNGP